MCASCGCGMINENHGDVRNITLSDLRRAAEAAGISIRQVVENLEDIAESSEEYTQI